MANPLTGLLGPPARTCLRGHGPMIVAEGSYALTGVDPDMPLQGVRAPAQLFAPSTFRPNGRVYALKIWRCPTCGFVELVDQE